MAQAAMPASPFISTALYIRLSVEDNNKRGNSIETQKLVLEKFLLGKPELRLYDIYIDNGATGTNFNRDGFQRMLSDIESGKVGCVIVKDLSRLGRNAIDTGYYIERYFPSHNVRFISVTDQFDSENPDNLHGGIILPLKNMINEAYALDIGRKIKAQARQDMKEGKYVGARAPFGYMKDPDDHHHLIVDPVAAEVVKNIFDWFLQGMSILGIAKRLNHMGIPNPSAYKRQCGLNYKHPAGQLDSAWPDSSVKRVLKNRLYVGDMVQNKNRTKSYKVQVSVAVPEEKWVIVPNMHEAIIDREKFETVQQLLMRDTRTSPGINHVSIFAGYIRCADCLRAMGKKSVAQSYGKYHYYVCQTFRKAGRNLCTKHTIREKLLYDAVLATIQSQIDLAVSMDQLVNDLKSQNVRAAKSSRLEKMLQLKEEEYEKVSRCRIDLYPDWKAGILSKDEYLSLKAKIGEQLEQIEIAIANIKEEISKYQSAPVSENKFISSFLRYCNIQVLTREVIVELIEMIYVHEGGTITIQFKYQDEYQRLLDLIDEQGLASAAG